MGTLAGYRKLIANLLGGLGTTGATAALGDSKLTLIVGAISAVQSVLVALAKNEPTVDKVDQIAQAANDYLDQVLAESSKAQG